MINSLPIWSDSNELSWYRSVADNKLPAKYLISRRVGIPDDYTHLSTTELWDHHNNLAKVMLNLRRQIAEETVNISSIPIKSPNLLDMNVELVNRMTLKLSF